MSHFGRQGPPDIADTYSLLVKDITFRTTADDLFPLFDKYGKVVDIFIPRVRRTGKSRGFAFVHYKYADEASKAVDMLDGRMVDGREITVQFAKYGPNAERIHKGRIIETSPRSKSSRSRSPSRRRNINWRSYGEVIRRRMSSESEPRGRLKSEPRIGKRPIQDQEQEPLKSEPQVWRWKQLKSEWVSRGKDVLKTNYLSKKYEDDDKPFMFNLDGLVYMNKAWQRNHNPNVYAYPPCPVPVGVGGLVPLYIYDDNLPTLISHCQLALNFYNNTNQGPTFVFHQLVNCSYFPPNALAPGLTYHITFQAQTVGSPSNITTFMAKVTEAFQDEPPRVFDRVIKF